MLRVGVVGISGYSGGLALEILLNHPNIRVTYASAYNTHGKVTDILPHLKGRTNLICKTYSPEQAIQLCDLIFLAVPHTTSMEIVPKLLKANKKVIDLSADYRLKASRLYKKWYGVAHKDLPNLGKAVYGLPEFYRAKIKKASFIANPGCYPTAAILGLAPIVSTMFKSVQSITIDAKSGVTGAGKKLAANFLFAEVNENFKAYRVLNHQHTPEINQYLSKVAGAPVNATFVPHLLPINRGILETIYIHLKEKVSLTPVIKLYDRFYKTEPFVRVLEGGIQPEIKNVVGTNYCDIGLARNDQGNILVVTSVIDNLIKGAAGQAVQNMNIMYGFPEEQGLL